jgi:hypothetical protein
VAAVASDQFVFCETAAANRAVDRHLGEHRTLTGLPMAGLTLGAILRHKILVSADESLIANWMHAMRSTEGHPQGPSSMARVHSVILPV